MQKTWKTLQLKNFRHKDCRGRYKHHRVLHILWGNKMSLITLTRKWREMDICHLCTSDIPANSLGFARCCLSHLYSNHSNIAIVSNGFHCSIIAELTNSCGVNESFFPMHSRKTKFSFTRPHRMIRVYYASALAMAWCSLFCPPVPLSWTEGTGTNICLDSKIY